MLESIIFFFAFPLHVTSRHVKLGLHNFQNLFVFFGFLVVFFLLLLLLMFSNFVFYYYYDKNGFISQIEQRFIFIMCFFSVSVSVGISRAKMGGGGAIFA